MENEDKSNKEYYPVFEVNDFFDEWGTSSFYVGAEDRQDLINHLSEIGRLKQLPKKQISKIIKEEWRITEIEHMFTDTPYISLTSNGYIE